jgi:hypothetical protein
VASVCVEHNWMLCQFPEPFQRALYTGVSHVLAPGVIAPTGLALREDGGYRLRGRWQWGTGVRHASWVLVGALADLEPGTPPTVANMRFFALPIAGVKVEDTWYVGHVLEDVAQGSGASAHFLQQPLQRALRDANVASCHIVFDLDTHRATYGKALLGLDVGGALL